MRELKAWLESRRDHYAKVLQGEAREWCVEDRMVVIGKYNELVAVINHIKV